MTDHCKLRPGLAKFSLSMLVASGFDGRLIQRIGDELLVCEAGTESSGLVDGGANLDRSRHTAPRVTSLGLVGLV